MMMSMMMITERAKGKECGGGVAMKVEKEEVMITDENRCATVLF